MFYQADEAAGSSSPSSPSEAPAPASDIAPAVILDDDGDAAPPSAVHGVRDASDDEWNQLLALNNGDAGDDEDTVGNTTGPKVEPAEEAPAEPEEAEPAATPEPMVMPEWTSTVDFDLEAVPEPARAWVDLALKAHEADVAAVRESNNFEVASSKQAYEAATAELKQVLAGLPDAEDASVAKVMKTLTEAYGPLRRHAAEANAELAYTTMELFNARHPEYAAAPDAVKKTFADTLNSEESWKALPGTRPVEKYEASWRKANQAHGRQMKPVEKSAVVPASKPVAPVKPAATPAAPAKPAVGVPRPTQGSPATVPGATGRVAKNLDEVFDRFDHLPMPEGVGTGQERKRKT